MLNNEKKIKIQCDALMKQMTKKNDKMTNAMIIKLDNKLKQREKIFKRKNKEIIKMNDELSTEKKTSKKLNALAKRRGSEKYYAEHKAK